jgi:hypothetical protein
MVGLKKRLSYMGEAGNPAGGWGGGGGGGSLIFRGRQYHGPKSDILSCIHMYIISKKVIYDSYHIIYP